MNSSRPARVWYNISFRSNSGMPEMPGRLASASGGIFSDDPPTYAVSAASRLTWPIVRSLASVMVVVDMRRTEGLTVEQLANYVAMVGLTVVHLDANLGAAPTILHLFDRTAGVWPERLTEWDEALLKSVYTTEQKSVMQLARIKRGVFRTVAP